MNRFDSIYLRVAAILLIGLLAAQWVAERLYQEERERVISHLIAGPLGQRLSMVADKLERTTAGERADLLRILNSPRITFRLASRPLAATSSGRLGTLQGRLQETLGAQRQVSVSSEIPTDDASPTVLISFRLADGQIIIEIRGIRKHKVKLAKQDLMWCQNIALHKANFALQWISGGICLSQGPSCLVLFKPC